MDIEDRANDCAYITGAVNAIAQKDDLNIHYTEHCKERMLERDITTLDIINTLRTGTITEYVGMARHPTSTKCHKYKITADYIGSETSTREISLVIILEFNRLKQPNIKIQSIVTAMWQDPAH